MNEILSRKKNDLLKGSLLNLFGTLLFTVPIYALAFMACFMIWHHDAWWIALIGVFILFVAGLITRLNGKFSQWRLFTAPYEPVSGGAHAVNKEILKVTGTASVVSDFIIGGAGQLLDFITKQKLISVLSKIDENKAADLIDTLQRKGKRPRMHPVSDFVDYKSIIAPLIAADILWYSEEKGISKIGLNTEYDQ